jgi:hypothetical protein
MTSFGDLTLGELHRLRDGLVRALASDTRRIEYEANGLRRVVEYRSGSEIRTALAAIEARLAAASGGGGVKVCSIRSEKGWAA